MAKIAILFVAAFCLVQIGMSARIEKRDAGDVEITTQGFLDIFKNGFEKVVSDDNINKMKERLGEIGTNLKEGAQNAMSNIQAGVEKALKKDETTAAPTPAS